MKLFRPESVSHAIRRLDGEVTLDLGFSWISVGIALVVVVAGAILFASVSTYARKEAAVGWLVPSGGIIRATAREGGLVETLFIQEGDIVPLGADLAEIRRSLDTVSGDDGDRLEALSAAQIRATSAGMEAEVARLGLTLDSLRARRSALEGEHAESLLGAELLGQQQALEAAAVERARDLHARGYLSNRDLERAEAQWLAARQAVSTARSASLALRREIVETDNQIRTMPVAIEQTREQGLAATSELEQRRTQLTSAARYRLTAPVAGRVLALPAQQGQSVPAGATLAILAGTGQRVVAEIFVPSRAAGFVREGHTVSIQYQSYPYQKFGSGRGRVDSVSSTVLAPSEVAIAGLGLQEPVFKVRVELERDFVSAYGERIALQPGMILTANIIVDRRSLLEWLLDPLYAVGRRT